jgi:plastocyanin
MRKTIFKITMLLTLVLLSSCSEDGIGNDTSFLDTVNSGNLNKVIDISNDNSGIVKITPTGEGYTNYAVTLGHGSTDAVMVNPGQSITYVYPEGSYTVTIESFDITGESTIESYPFTITYRAPENLLINGSSNGYEVSVAPTADYANSYWVYFGDVPNEQPTVLGVGQSITHTYAAPGVYTVTVVAQSGGAATTTATSQIIVYAPYSLPITYEDATQNYGIGGTFGGVGTAVVANPFPGGINSSATVWQYSKPVGAESWSGTWTPLAEPAGVPINIDNGGKIKVMVYATETGKLLNLELEQASSGIDNQVLKVAPTVANQWQELVFDFSVLGIPAGTTFKQLVFRYNDTQSGVGEVIYIDNVTQSN